MRSGATASRHRLDRVGSATENAGRQGALGTLTVDPKPAASGARTPQPVGAPGDEKADTFERIADDLVEEFYEHLGDYDETVAVLDSSSKPVAALKKTQREYLLDLGRGEYGQSYFDRRARIGKIHDMLELGPEAYLGAYAIYYEGLADAIGEDVRAEFGAAGEGTDTSVDADADARANADADGAVGRAVEEALGRFCSALKLMNLDQQVAMDTYIHSYSQRMEEEIERRNDVSEEVGAAVQESLDSAQTVADRTVRRAPTPMTVVRVPQHLLARRPSPRTCP